ncbi:MAG TPA: hypothetical protein VE891_09810 [Allosphingosinicella sp.]|nr:hypothetical protein [Allosphingosinicella sp.]
MNDCPDLGSGDDDSSPVESEKETRLHGLRSEVERELDDIKSGRVADMEQALDRIEAMLDELEAAKRV